MIQHEANSMNWCFLAAVPVLAAFRQGKVMAALIVGLRVENWGLVITGDWV